MQQNIKFSVLESFESLTHLAQELFGASRNRLKRYRVHQIEIEIRAKEVVSLPLDIVNRLIVNPLYEGPRIPVLAEDSNILFLDKPAGVHCHPLTYCESDNCLSFLRSREHRGDLFEVNSKSYERGLLWRLDNVTSGVLAVVKNEELFQKLRENFSNYVKEKVYIAAVRGCPPVSGNLKAYFLPSEQKGHIVKCFEEYKEGAKPGELNLEILNYSKDRDLSIVRVKLKTGLRHQIRSHLSSLGTPILGDTLYGAESAPRVFLHAQRYSIIIDQGQQWNVSSGDESLFNALLHLNG